MSCTAQIGLTSQASNGADPIAGTVTWTDGAGSHSQSVNQPYPGTPTNVTLTGPTSVQMTASSPGFESQTLTVTCQSYTQFQLTQQGGSSSGGGLGCFIVTAAYGTETAPEVELLQGFRDKVLRRTRWGSKLFEELWKYYYRVSPAIAGEMIRDPELRRVLSFAIVEPWVNYMKLMMSRPDFKSMNLDGLDPKLRAFLLQFQGYGDKWIKGVELPKSFKGRDPMESVDELNMVLGVVLLHTDGRAYLQDLERRGELPLRYPKEMEAKLRSALTDAGRTEDELTSILYGAASH